MSLDKQDHRLLVLWAADCAGHVLPYFEEKYPKDDRPRKALEAARAWARGGIKTSEARAAAFGDWQYQRLPEHLRLVADDYLAGYG